MRRDLTGQAVFNKAFSTDGRQHRSAAYKQGALNCLRARIDGFPFIPCPYRVDTIEAGDYHAGVAEGRALSPVDTAPSGFEDE